jgi:membrane dipeptidase
VEVDESAGGHLLRGPNHEMRAECETSPAMEPTTRPVVDCHNDWIAMFARERSLGRMDSLARRFIPQFRSGGINVQVTAIYLDPEWVPEGALRRTLLFIRDLKEEVDRTEGATLCTEGTDIQSAVDAGELALVLALEGSHAIGADPSLFEVFFDLGVRMASFTHMGNTFLAGGSADGDPGGGLTTAGREAVKLLERLGIVMDVSHLSTQSTDDVLALASRPLVASHSSLRSICDHHRNITDEHAKGIAALGGVIGVPAAIPFFIDSDRPTIDRVVDHVEHIAGIVGIDHVGIGADFIREYIDEAYPTYSDITVLGEDARAVIDGLTRPEDMPKLVNALEDRGIVGEDLDKVLGGNFLRVFREVMGVGS